MTVANGGDAQRAFDEMIAPKTPLERRETLEKALLEYCEKDTIVMVDLVRWMLAQANN